MSESKSIILFTDISVKQPALGYDTKEVDSAHVRDADDGWAVLQVLQDSSLNVDSVLISFGNAWSWLNSPDAPTDLQPDPEREWPFMNRQVSWVRRVARSVGKRNTVVEKGSILQYQFDSSLSDGAQRIVDRIRENYDSENRVSLVGVGTATDVLKVVNSLQDVGDLDHVESVTLEMGLYGRYADGLSITGSGGTLRVGDANFLNDIGAVSELLKLENRPTIYFVPFNSVRMGPLSPDELYALPRGGVNQFLVEGTKRWYFDRWREKIVAPTGSEGFHVWDVVATVSESQDSSFDTVPVKAKVVSDQLLYPGATGVLRLRGDKTARSNAFVRRMPLSYGPDLVGETLNDPSTDGVTFSEFDASNNYDNSVIKQIALRSFYAPLKRSLRMSMEEGNLLVGNSGKDVLIGFDDGDTLIGLGRNDILLGQAGRDHLLGGSGADRLVGGFGNDVLEGGLGGDMFVVGYGVDLVRDFNASEGDFVAVQSTSVVSYRQIGEDLSLIFNGGVAAVTLANTSMETFDPATDLVLY